MDGQRNTLEANNAKKIRENGNGEEEQLRNVEKTVGKWGLG